MAEEPGATTAAAAAAAEAPLRVPRALEAKAMALLLLLALLLGASALYVLYARGVFEATRKLTLVVDNAEGIGVGSDLGFAGFPIGRVRRIELAADGNAHIVVDVAEKSAHWLRSSSIFTLERALVGGARLRAFSGVLSDPELPPGSTRPLLVGDAAAEIPKLVGATKALVDNLNALLAADGSIGATLANLRGLSERLNAPGGALGALLGDGADSRQIALTVQRTNALLARLDKLAANADKMGWYIKVNQTVAIGEDGGYYILTMPGGLRERITGVRLQPSLPSLEVSRGGRDGETGDLSDFLTKRLRQALGGCWSPPTTP